MRKLFGSRAAIEVAAIAGVAIVVLILTAVLNTLDGFANWARQNQSWGADGLLPGLFVVVLGLGLISVRNWRQAVQDLKAQQAKEEHAKEQELRYKALFEEALNPIFLADTRGYYREVNTAALQFLECQKEELAERGLSELKVSNHRPDSPHPDSPLGVRCTVETEYRVDGRTKTLMLNMTPMKVGENTVLFGIGQDITHHKQTEQEQEALIRQLQDTLSHTKVLRGLLPICANCKRIRDERGYWHSVERYISDRLDVRFTHGVCPECMRTLYGDLMKD